jgi:hypothetical protein
MQPELTISLQHLAIIVTLVIIFAFMVGAHPFKKKKRLVIADIATPEQKPLLWTAGDYFIFINSLILASNNWAELDKAMVYVENYKDKEFRVAISESERDRYYNRLIASYDKKVNEFETVCFRE